MKPTYFTSPAEFRAWFEKHHYSATELWAGYHKKGSGTPSITSPESVDEALCFGWIDGIRKSIDENRYTIRFTRRKPKSNWSNINIERVAELQKLGRMTPAGLRAFEEREAKRDYSYEQTRSRSFRPEQEKTFRANRKAWAFFEQQPPSYRKTLIYWVTSAKKEETRASRLEKLIDASAAGRRIGDAFTNRVSR
ncbi:MAG: YdeI/OmpD-associated family protein [Gemmatimonadaceae bacterium]